MLVLSRQRDETIMIGDDIAITVVDIRGDKVRLGINAPTRIAVHRKEVYDAIRAENQRAAAIANGDLAALKTAMAQPGRVHPGGAPAKAVRLAAGHGLTLGPAGTAPVIRPTGTAPAPHTAHHPPR